MDNTAKNDEFLEYLITFRSVTFAQRAMSVLESGGVVCALSRTPQVLAAKGCGYCLRLKAGWSQAGEMLKKRSVPYSKAYGQRRDGSFQEIRL